MTEILLRHLARSTGLENHPTSARRATQGEKKSYGGWQHRLVRSHCSGDSAKLQTCSFGFSLGGGHLGDIFLAVERWLSQRFIRTRETLYITPKNRKDQRGHPPLPVSFLKRPVSFLKWPVSLLKQLGARVRLVKLPLLTCNQAKLRSSRERRELREAFGSYSCMPAQ